MITTCTWIGEPVSGKAAEMGNQGCCTTHTTRKVFTIVVEITLHLCLSSISVRTGALHAVMSNGDISMQMARVYPKQYGTGCGT